MTTRSVIDGGRVGMETHPHYQPDPYASPDYVPPAALRTPETGRPVPLPRSDLKAPLDLRPADLAKRQVIPPGVTGPRGMQDGRGPLTIRQQMADEVAAHTAPTPAPTQAPGLVFGAGFRRGETRARILHFLEHAPPGAAYTCQEITAALSGDDGSGPALSAVNSQCYHYKEWMPQLERRLLIVSSGLQSQYRWRQDHPWPPLPAGARVMTGPSHRVRTVTRRATTQTARGEAR